MVITPAMAGGSKLLKYKEIGNIDKTINIELITSISTLFNKSTSALDILGDITADTTYDIADVINKYIVLIKLFAAFWRNPKYVARHKMPKILGTFANTLNSSCPFLP